MRRRYYFIRSVTCILDGNCLRLVPATRNPNNPIRNEQSECRVGYAAGARGCVPEAHYYSIANATDGKSGFLTTEVSVYTRFVEIQVAAPCGIVNILSCTPKVSEYSFIKGRNTIARAYGDGGKTRGVMIRIRHIARCPRLGRSIPTFACQLACMVATPVESRHIHRGQRLLHRCPLRITRQMPARGTNSLNAARAGVAGSLSVHHRRPVVIFFLWESKSGVVVILCSFFVS